VFQTVPLELDNDPASNWAVLPSFGRNLPGYQFTSSEHIVTFDLTWYCDDETREDVIRRVKWLEALSKADGYEGSPHPIQFIFGDLYKDATFIVDKAPYKLREFNREYRMLPLLALQSVTLKKISNSNPKRFELLKTTS
jgi:hypothetical protein